MWRLLYFDPSVTGTPPRTVLLNSYETENSLELVQFKCPSPSLRIISQKNVTIGRMNFLDDYNMNIEETLHAQGPPERRSLLVMGVEIAMCIFLKAMTKAFLGVSGDAYCITGNSILLSQYMSLWRHYPYGYENNRRRRGWAPIWVEVCTWVPYYQLMKSFTQMRSIEIRQAPFWLIPVKEIHQSLFCFSQWLIVNNQVLTSSFLFSLSLCPPNYMSRYCTILLFLFRWFILWHAC